ncbi:flagellar hook-associated protein FlgK [Novilysobacter arseniciresistens]|nr:flagellar hook-associated protein FlgK [Lysobacter arseniciresistens]
MLSTGSSALLAFQRALATVGNNVANAATPGYSRQRVELETRPGQTLGASTVGTGVNVARLQRLADGLVFARQVDSSGELGRLQQLSSLSARVDSLMSDSATGLGAPWSAFFAAAEGVVAEPTSTSARSQLLASGEQLAARWRSMDAQMATMEDEVDVRIEAQVAAANKMASEIASLNKQIVAAGGNATPELLDQRALRIEKLAALVGAETVEQDNGAVNVFTPGGQALVLGNKSMALSTASDPYRPDRVQIALESPGGSIRLPSSSVSGEVGGLVEFRERVLDPMRAELGRLAVAFAHGFNETQRAGVDYNGAPGSDMFSLPSPRVDRHAGNTGSATLTAGIGDVGALKGHDLVLRFDAGSWSATRAGSGEAVPLTGSGTAADPLVVDGVELVVGGTPANGDRFSLRPTSGAASGLQVVLDDPLGIAAASPLQASADPANLGGASAGASRITDSAAFAGFTGATVEFIDATQYTVDGNGPFAWTPGTPVSGDGWSLELDGAPAAGDRFSLTATPPRSSDNANARALAAVDTDGILDGGSVGLTAGLAQLTGRAGSEARHAGLSLEAQDAIHAQVMAERESVSGVNLDEEAADLLRYQQAYQAAAQIIKTADDMFQTLLGAVR